MLRVIEEDISIGGVRMPLSFAKALALHFFPPRVKRFASRRHDGKLYIDWFAVFSDTVVQHIVACNYIRKHTKNIK